MKLNSGLRGSRPADPISRRRQLSFGCFAVERCARVLDRAVEGLPGLADNLFVCRHRAFGCHAQCVGLDTHVGREFPLALGGAIVADRTVEILVAGIVRCLGRCVARFTDGAGVELSGPVRRSDEGSDDALQMDLHCLFAQASERLSAVSTISRSCRLRMPSLSTTAVPKLSPILSAWTASGQERRTISSVVPRRDCADLAVERLGMVGLAMSVPSVAAEAVPARAGLPFDVDDQNRQRTDGFTGPIRLSQQGRFAAQQVLTCLGPRACPRAERLDRPLRGAQAALKRPAAGSDRNEKKGSGTGPMSDARRRRTTWPSPPPWEMSWLQDDQMPPSAQPR